MPACSPLHLVMEIRWPASLTGIAETEATLPACDAALDRAIFPKHAERVPASLIHLAVTLLRPRVTRRLVVVHPASNVFPYGWPCALRVAPSVHGIVLAARFLAFRRGAARTTPRDATAAIALVCEPSFAVELGHRAPAVAAAFARRRRLATKTASAEDADIAWLLATFGPYIHPSFLAGVIHDLRTLLGPDTLHQLNDFSEANAFAVHVLRHILPPTLIEPSLVEGDSRRLVRDVLEGPAIEDVRTFLVRVLRATLAHVRVIDDYVDQILTNTFISKPAVRTAIAHDSSPGSPVDAPQARSARDRADRAIVDMTRLLPQQPHLVSLLVGKAALLGTELPPSPIFLTGGSAEARRTVLRTLARATDAAFVLVDASRIGGLSDAPTGALALLSKPESMDLPLHLSAATGSIVVIDGCDALFSHEDFDYDWQRAQRLGAQRVVAHLLTDGVPTSMSATFWPQSPAFFICCTDDEVNTRTWHAGLGILPALSHVLGEHVYLPDRPSIALMVELLRPMFTPRARREVIGAAAVSRPDSIEVPEATLAVAARLASERRGTLADARRVIEAAARRIVLGRAQGETSERIVITPDDLSASDLTA